MCELSGPETLGHKFRHVMGTWLTMLPLGEITIRFAGPLVAPLVLKPKVVTKMLPSGPTVRPSALLFTPVWNPDWSL
jgi:hypothetical protein